MIIGQTLHATGAAGSPGPTPVYSPWFSRGGDQGEFACEIIYKTAACDVEITIETKNSEDKDSGAAQPTAGGIFGDEDASGFKKASATGFEELVV